MYTYSEVGMVGLWGKKEILKKEIVIVTGFLAALCDYSIASEDLWDTQLAGQ